MRLRNLIPLLLLSTFGALSFTGCGGSGGDVTQGTEAQVAEPGIAADAAAAEALGYIPSSKAGEHMGEDVTVRGSVKDYQYVSGRKGRPYILLFDKPGIVERGSSVSDMKTPESFKVVVWKQDHKNFPANFAGGYAGHTVCVTGTVVEYDGKPAIEAHDPRQLEIDC